jgi:hypothetical protein
MSFAIRRIFPSFSKTKILFSSRNTMLVGEDNPSIAASTFKEVSVTEGWAYIV